MLDSCNRSSESIAVSQGASMSLKFINLYQIRKYVRQIYFGESRDFYQIEFVKNISDDQSQASIIAKYLRLRYALSHICCKHGGEKTLF